MRLWKRRPHLSREAQYLAGQLQPTSDRPSVMHFTLHKCASVYLQTKLHMLAEQIGLTPLDLDGYFFDSAQPQPFTVQRRGFFYGPFRSLDDAFGVRREWPDLRGYKIIVVIRDPRDVLTSLYYSMAYSHRTPRGDARDSFLAMRQEVQQIDIDQHVRQEARVFLPRYRSYFRLAQQYDVHLTTYEQLVTNPDAWRESLLAYLGVVMSRWRKRRLISAADFAVKRENPAAHMRQVQPGDHARKLRPDTIAWLNAEFAEVLDWYGKTGRNAAA